MERNDVSGDIKTCKQSVQTHKGFELMAAPCELPSCWDWQKAMGAAAGEEDPTDWAHHGPDPTVHIIYLTYSLQHGEYDWAEGTISCIFLGFISTTLQTIIEVTPDLMSFIAFSTFPMMDTSLPLQPPTTTPDSHNTFQL